MVIESINLRFIGPERDSKPVPGDMIMHVHDDDSLGIVVGSDDDVGLVVWTKEPTVIARVYQSVEEGFVDTLVPPIEDT